MNILDISETLNSQPSVTSSVPDESTPAKLNERSGVEVRPARRHCRDKKTCAIAIEIGEGKGKLGHVGRGTNSRSALMRLMREPTFPAVSVDIYSVIRG